MRVRVFLALALTVLLAASISACDSGSSGTTATTGSTRTGSTATGTATGADGGATAQGTLSDRAFEQQVHTHLHTRERCA